MSWRLYGYVTGTLLLSRAIMSTATTSGGGGVFSECLSQAMDLIARCRYAEMMAVKQGDDIARSTLIHTIFENQKVRGKYPLRKSLSDMIDEHGVATFNPEMDIKDVYRDLELETDDQKLVMLFIAVVNACREQMYANHNAFFVRDVKPEIFKAEVERFFGDAGLKVDDITGELVKDGMFQYLRSAKQLNQLRNSLIYDIFDAERRDSREVNSWLSGLKKKINAYMDENRGYEEVLDEVLKSGGDLRPAENEKLKQKIEECRHTLGPAAGGLGSLGIQPSTVDGVGEAAGFSNLAQFCHTMWTSFWKIRDGGSRNRSLVDITTQTIRLLGIVPQLLEFPGIVVELSKKLKWFSERKGSLQEFFGVGKDSLLLEELIEKLKRTAEVARSRIQQEKESQTKAVGKLPDDGDGGGNGDDKRASDKAVADELEELCKNIKI